MNDIILQPLDMLLGWSLYLPRDLTLLILALITSGLLVIARRWLTDQQLLRRCRDDKRQLKALIRQARREKDRAAVARMKLVKQQLTLLAFRCEGKPLLAILIPIILLTTWGFGRMDYLPAQPGEPIAITATLPATQAGHLIHIVPVTGITAVSGWVQEVAVTDDAPPQGQATWQLRAQASAQPYELTLRYRGQAYPFALQVGTPYYELPVIDVDAPELSQIHVGLTPYRPFGFIPGWGMMLPAWIVGYLVIALPVASLIKRLTRIY